MNDKFCLIFAIIWLISGIFFGLIFGNSEYFRMAMIIATVYNVGQMINVKIEK